MPQETQLEFLWEGNSDALALPLESDPYIQSVSEFWGLPIGRQARVEVCDRSLDVALTGVLELLRAPRTPWQRTDSLPLRIGTIEFGSRSIRSWTALE